MNVDITQGRGEHKEPKVHTRVKLLSSCCPDDTDSESLLKWTWKVTGVGKTLCK